LTGNMLPRSGEGWIQFAVDKTGIWSFKAPNHRKVEDSEVVKIGDMVF
jgi:hypothetical protein